MRNQKAWMAALLSTTLLFSGAALSAPKAYADDDDSLPVFTKAKPALDTKRFVSEWMSDIFTKAVAFAGTDKDYADIRDALAAGSTLAEATGLGSELSQKLLVLADSGLSQVSQNYSVSAEQLDTLRTELYNEIQAAVSTPGYVAEVEKGKFDFSSLLGQRLAEAKSIAVGMSDEEPIDIEDALSGGQSLLGAAQVDKASLVSALAAPVLDEIEAAVNAKRISAEEGSKLTDKTLSSIESAIAAPGGVQAAAASSSVTASVYAPAKFNASAFIRQHLRSIASDAYLVAEKDDLEFDELKRSYLDGVPLTQLTDLPAYTLATRILKLWEPELADLPEATRSDVLEQALRSISEAVSTGVSANK
ncbi:hypothetical protein [Paenibacillus hamazuiensis]|uniref:hypothetical protein n=1 Tax=Paenibacillus hamazuiensis TaxID=2936508 RepID=UPI00200DE213|nr:hypothetical protein [Paenibacillus hamazuiensis]